MTERARPPGLDTIAGDGLKLGARLALGLLSAPLVGLALLASRKAAPKPIPDQPAPAPPAAEQEPDAASDSPGRRDVESALERLTEATIPKARPGKRTATPSAADERRSKPTARKARSIRSKLDRTDEHRPSR